MVKTLRGGVPMYNWKRFSLSISGSIAALCFIIGILWNGGIAFAVPVAGVGGFTITADEIQMNNYKMLPSAGETSEKPLVPQARVSLDAAIKNMKLTKDLDAPFIGNVRIFIQSTGTVKATNMILDMTKMASDTQFSKLTIAEKNSDNPTKKFMLSSPDAVLKNPKIIAHYLFANTISIPDMQFHLDINPEK